MTIIWLIFSFKMISKFILFKLIFSFLVYFVELNLIFNKDYNTVGNVTISLLGSNIQGNNFSGPLIPISKQNSSTFLNQLTTTDFDFWEICYKTFFVRDNHVSVVTLDNEFLEVKDVYSKRGLVTWYTATDHLHFAKNVIIVVKSLNQFNKLFYAKHLWYQETIFVILLLECSRDVELEMENLWQIHKIYNYVLVCGAQKPLLYMYRPYVPEKRSKIVEIKDITEIVSIMVHAVDNLFGSQIRVVLFPQIPTALIDMNGKFIGGVDYCSLQVLQERMNFSMVIYPPTDGQTFPQPGKKLSGSVQDLVAGKADIAFNGHFLQNYGINDVEMTRHVYMDKLCFVVAMPSFKSHYTVIIHIFSQSLWCLLIVVYFLTIFVYYMILKLGQTKQHRPKFKDLFLHMYVAFITGATTLKPDRSSQRILIGVVLLGLLILSNTFQGLLTTVLSRPRRNPFIDTIDQVTKSELALQSQHAESLVSDPEILQLLKALRQREATTSNFIRLARFPIMNFEKYYTYISYWPAKNITEHLHTVQECIKSNYISFVVPLKSPLLRKINIYVVRFQESGLLAKWFSGNLLLRKIFWPVENEKTAKIPPKVFAVKDLTAIFYILGYGLTIGTVVFLIENVLGRFKLCKTLCRRGCLFKK